MVFVLISQTVQLFFTGVDYDHPAYWCNLIIICTCSVFRQSIKLIQWWLVLFNMSDRKFKRKQVNHHVTLIISAVSKFICSWNYEARLSIHSFFTDIQFRYIVIVNLPLKLFARECKHIYTFTSTKSLSVNFLIIIENTIKKIMFNEIFTKGNVWQKPTLEWW